MGIGKVGKWFLTTEEKSKPDQERERERERDIGVINEAAKTAGSIRQKGI